MTRGFAIPILAGCSFASHDIDPDRVTKAGARPLTDYLEYAGSGGTAVGAAGRDQRAACGSTVVPRYG